MDLFGTVSSLTPIATMLRNRGARSRELSVCVKNALYRACANQRSLRDPSEVVDALLSPVTHDELGEWFAELQLDSAHQEIWKSHLRLLIDESKYVDPDQFELDELVSDFGRYLKEEIVQRAGKYGSFLFNEVSLRKSFSELEESPTPQVNHGLPKISNFWTLPVLPQTAPRSELDAIEESLLANAVVVVSGGVGSGKTVIARLLAERIKPKDEGLMWWLDGSSEESLMSSCEALLSTTGTPSGQDVFNSVKGLFASASNWLIVVDDLFDLDLFSKIIPGVISSGTVIVTTRQQTSGKFGPEIRLGKAEESVLHRICQLALTIDCASGALKELIEFCDGNPLAMATICRYLNYTGISADDLIGQLRESPVAALSQGSGVHDEDSFFRIVQTAIERFPEDGLSFLVLSVSSMAGGYALPHQLFVDVLAAEPELVLKSIRKLQSMGLVEARDSRLGCSRLVASIVGEKIDSTMSESMRERIIYSIARSDGFMERDILRSLGLVLLRVANNKTLSNQRIRESVLSIAGYHISRGVFATSQRLLEKLEKLQDNDVATVACINLLKSSVSLHVGDYSKAINESQFTIELMESEQHDADICANAYVVQAWAMENLGDRVAARRAAKKASLWAPTDAEVSHVSQNFSISLLAANEQVDEYLKLGEDETLVAGLRALNYCRASRALVSLGRATDAVVCARKAMELDSADGNEQSHYYARDLNDLGMALIGTGDLDQAEEYLLQSLSLYCQDTPSDALAALPRLHLGRLYTLRAFLTDDNSASQALNCTARGYLEDALESVRISAPRSPDIASILVALSETIVGDHETAISLLREALEIDREVYGNDHFEVAIDVTKLMERLILNEDSVQAMKEYSIIKKYVPLWEPDYPNVALWAVTFHLIACYKTLGRDRYFNEILSHLRKLLSNSGVDNKTAEGVKKLLGFYN